LKRTAYYILYIIFILSFFQGVLSQFFTISESFTRILIHILILTLISFSFLSLIHKKAIYKKTTLLFSFLLLTIFISAVLNNMQFAMVLLFLRAYILPLLFFYALIIIDLTKKQQKNLLKLLIILFLIQIPATIYKLLTIGPGENIIGTVSIDSGSVATILPLLAISFIILYNDFYKKRIYLLLIPLFILIGIASMKLAIIVYLVALMFFIFSLNNNLKILFSMRTVKYIIMFFILSSSMIFVILNTNARLLKHGQFNLDYAIKYVETYTQRDRGVGDAKGASRLSAVPVVFNLLEQKGFEHVLLGFGPGDIIKSSLSKYSNPAYEKYQLGYGVRTGFLQLTMQIGIIGAILYLSIHIIIFLMLFNNKKNIINYSVNDALILLIAISFIFIFLIDFFSYSTVLMKQTAMTLTYFFILAYAISITRNIHAKA